jgi:hypothetical protein
MTNRIQALLALLMLACGSSGSAGPAAVVALSASPNPIHEIACPPSDCGSLAGQDEATTTVTVTESAGVGVEVTRVSMVLALVSTGAVMASGTFDGNAIASLAGSNRVAAHGQLAIPVGVHYDQSLAGRPSTLTVTATATDDHGHDVSATVAASVVP